MSANDAEHVPSQDYDPTAFTDVLNSYNKRVHLLISCENFPGLTNDQLAAFKSIYGPTAFVCRFSGCVQSTTGFATDQLRGQHEQTHTPQLTCTDPNCSYGLSFSSQRALSRHVKEHHNKSQPKVPVNVRFRSTKLSLNGFGAKSTPQPSVNEVATAPQRLDNVSISACSIWPLHLTQPFRYIIVPINDHVPQQVGTTGQGGIQDRQLRQGQQFPGGYLSREIRPPMPGSVGKSTYQPLNQLAGGDITQIALRTMESAKPEMLERFQAEVERMPVEKRQELERRNISPAMFICRQDAVMHHQDAVMMANRRLQNVQGSLGAGPSGPVPQISQTPGITRQQMSSSQNPMDTIGGNPDYYRTSFVQPEVSRMQDKDQLLVSASDVPNENQTIGAIRSAVTPQPGEASQSGQSESARDHRKADFRIGAQIGDQDSIAQLQQIRQAAKVDWQVRAQAQAQSQARARAQNQDIFFKELRLAAQHDHYARREVGHQAVEMAEQTRPRQKAQQQAAQAQAETPLKETTATEYPVVEEICEGLSPGPAGSIYLLEESDQLREGWDISMRNGILALVTKTLPDRCIVSWEIEVG